MARRFVPLLVILVLGLGAWFWLDRSELWLRIYLKLIVGCAVLIFGALALVFAFARSRKARLAGAGVVLLAVAVAGVGLMQVATVEGYSGASFPQIRWIWDENDESPDLPQPGSAHPVPASPDLPAEMPAEVATASFPRFLGPKGDGVVSGVELETDWDSHPPELLWRRPVGLGWSGFVVADGRAVTQEQEGEHELVTCYALADGSPLWSHSNDARFGEAMSGEGPRATPTIDGNKVYAMGATGILDCLDLADGALVWSRDVLAGSTNLSWGKSNAPLVHDGLVVVTGGKSGPALLALDKATGEPVWNAEGGAASYSSPVVATLGGREQILAVLAKEVSSYEPTSGQRLWHHDGPGSHPKPAQPIPVGDDRVLISASYGVRSALLEVGGDGGGTGAAGVSTVWTSMKLPTKFSSALVSGGFAFGLGEGRMVCVDLADGSRVWRGDSYGYGQNLLVGETILVQAERGHVALVAADPQQFRELARLDALDGKTWNPPGLAGPFLLVRNATEAACYRLALR
ncbi:PQQ-binding-like beta-propeller repeat protein [soil metagenome]